MNRTRVILRGPHGRCPSWWMLVALVMLGFTSARMDAATVTWTGGSGGDPNWSNGLNWSGGSAPTTGDALVFDGVAGLTNTNDLTAGTVFASLTITAGSGNFIIGGTNSIVLSGGATALTSNATAGTMTLSLPITFSTAAPTITRATGGTLVLSGALDNGGFLLTTTGGGALTLSGAITGSGGFTKAGAGSLILSGASSYTGITTITTGTVRIDADVAPSTNGPFGNSAAAIVVAGGDLQVNTAVFSRSLSVTNGPSSLAAFGAPRTVSAPIAIAAGVEATTASFVAANLSVSQDDWRATQTIAGTRTDTLINQGNNAFGSAGERAAWGIGGSDADWNTFSVQWDGWLRIPHDGTNLFTRSDDGSRLTLINSTTGAVVGWTSNGWGVGQGATTRQVATNLSAGLYRYRVQYAEGTGGNEVRLLWSDATNSSVGYATGVAAGPTLPIVPSAFFGGFAVGNATDNLTLSGVISGAGSLTKIGSNTLILTANNTYTGATAITAGTLRNGGAAGVIADTSVVMVGTGATYDLNNLNETVGAIAGGGTIALGSAVLTSGASGNASTTVTGVITGTGSLIKNGSGTLTLGGTNTFSGGISLANGYVSPTVAGGLGTGTFTIAGGGNASALRVAGAVTIANPVVYNSGGVNGRSAIEATGVAATLSGPITINASTVNGGHLSSNGAGVLTISGAITSSVTVTVRLGTTVFSGGGSYAGMSVNEGTIRLGAVNGIATNAVIDLGTTLATTFDLNGFNQTLAGLQRTAAQTTTVTSATAATLTLNQTVNLTYGGAITGAISLVKSGSGSETLSGTNTYTGTTTVSGGTLVVGSATALGNVSGGTTVDAGANLTLVGVAVGAEPLNLSGTGIASAGALISSGTASFAGAITLAANASISTTGTLTLAGAVGDGGGVHGVTKLGSGTLIMTGTDTWTGASIVSAGTLLENGNASAASGTLLVASGATLGGTGTVGAAVTVASGGIIAPGSASAVTLTFAHPGTSLTMAAGAQSQFTLGTASDALNATGAAATVTLAGDLVVTAGAGFAAGNYTLATTTAGVNGAFSGVSFVPAIYSGVVDTTSDPTRAVLTVSYLVNPTVQANTGVTLVNSTASIITTSHLQVVDAEQGAAALTYTITSAPAYGLLRLNLIALGVGGTFTQDDIANNRVSYEHATPATLSDAFTFTVSDGAGGAIGATSFAITAVGPGLASGLVGYWPFDQVVGSTSLERTGTTNAASLQSATTLAVGRFGNAFNSGGSNTTNAVITRPVQDDFSIVFWFKTSAVGLSAVGSQWYAGRGLIDGEVGGSTNDFGVSLTGTAAGVVGVAAGTGATDVTATSPGAYDNNAWHQVAYTRTRSTGALALKVDQGTTYTATGGTQALTSPTNLRIGAIQTNANHFTGQIDDVRFYNRVLSAEEQQALYILSAGTNPVLANLDGDAVTATEDSLTALDFGSNATVTDSDDLVFGGGYLLVENVTGGADSSLVIATANGITTSGANVSYGGNVIGTIDGTYNGAAGAHLKVTFTTVAATNAAVTALVHAVSYLDTYGLPTARTVRLALSDGYQISDAATVTVTVVAVADGPTLRANTGITVAAGTVKALTTTMLNFSDPDYAAAQISLTVATAPAHGFLRRSGVAVGVGASITVADIASGIVSYEHGTLANLSDSVVLTPSNPLLAVANVTFAVTATGSGLSTGLLGHWRFNESATTTTARDATGRGFPGTLTNMAGTEWGAGQLGNALTLDGANDLVTVPTGISLANSSFTLAGWTRRATIGTADFLFGQGTGVTSQGLHLGFMADNRIRLGFWGNDLDTGPAYTDTTAWHHVAAVYNANTLARAIWRDGVSVASGVASANYSGTGTIQLGRGGPSGSSEFTGSLDDLRIYGRDLTSDELAFLGATPGAAPALANLDGDTVAYNEESAAVALDTGTVAVVSDADDLTLAGGTLFVDNLSGTTSTTLSVRSVGGITVSGNSVSYAGTVVGNIDAVVNGVAGTALRVSLDTVAATPTAVSALVSALGFADTASGTRTLRVSLSDGVGSAAALVTVTIADVNDAPVLAINTGVTAPVGGVAVIDNALLRATDEDNTAAQLVYTVTAVPTNGHLRLNLVALTVGAPFTQDDLDNRRVSYEHGTIAQTSDTFSVAVSDGSGGTIASTAVAVTISGTGLAQGLAARWALDETSGTVAADGSGNSNTGTVLNGAWAAGRLNNGVTLAGNGSVTTPASGGLNSTTAITVSGWVRTAQTSGSSVLRHDGHFTALQPQGGNAQVAYWIGGTLRTYAFPWNGPWVTNTWVHYTASYDQAAGLAIYFNGNLTHTSTTYLGALSTTANPFMLGASEGGGERFNGHLDEVRVYGRALSANDVRTLAQQAVPVIANLGGDAPIFIEDGGVVALDSGTAAVVTDADDTDFGGGWLRVHGTNLLAADTLSVLDVGTGAGQISVSGSIVSYAGEVIGSIDPTDSGAAGADLRINFSACAATPPAVSALVRALRFSTAGHTPDATSRVLQVTLSDNFFTSSIATVTMTVRPVPDVLSRITVDIDGDGQIDRIRLGFDQALNDVFTGLTVVVPGYTVTGYATGVTGADANIDVLLTESGAGDSSVTPAVQITGNTTLSGTIGGALVPVEVVSSLASDAVVPVLLSAVWSDGGVVGVSVDDRLVLTFSESIAVVGMTLADLGLPVAGDSLGTSVITDQTGLSVTLDLTGVPALTPVGTYSAGALTAGSASGLFVAVNSAISDSVGLHPLVGSAASARDLSVGTAIHALVDLNGPAAGIDYSAVYLNQAPAVAAVDAAALTVSDSDQSTVSGATMQLSGVLDGAAEVIDVTLSGAITKAWNAGAQTLTLSGTDTLANYQTVLRTLTYVNNAITTTAGDRTITVAVDDGHGLGPVATSTITVTYDAPPTALATTLLTAEGIAVQGMLLASDPENAALTWEIVSAPASGTLVLAAASGQVTYTPVLGVTSDVTFTFRVNDGWSWSTAATATIRITPRLTALKPRIVSAPPRLGWLGDPLVYQVVVFTGSLPAGADLSFALVGVPAGSTATLTKTSATTATLSWTATGTPDEHQQLGVLVSDPLSGTSSYQAIQVLWRTLPGGPG